MFDRHLYDMLPYAWSELNCTKTPAPLPPAQPMPTKKRTLTELQQQIDEWSAKYDALSDQNLELATQNVELTKVLDTTKANLEKMLHTIGDGTPQVKLAIYYSFHISKLFFIFFISNTYICFIQNMHQSDITKPAAKRPRRSNKENANN